MIYIGIDPGAGGGIAWSSDSDVYKGAVKMPATARDIVDLLEQFKGDKVVAAIEHVWSIPGQGGAFAFGCSVGGLRMALTAARIPFDPVLPKRWQQALGVRYPKGAADTVKKNISKARAQQLFPEQTITHAIADALLIAEYCRRTHRGSDGKEEKRPAQVHPEAGAGSSRSRKGQAQGQRVDGIPFVSISAAEARSRSKVAAAPRHGAGAQSSTR